MCLAKDYSEDLLVIYDNIIAEFNKLNHELSQADLYEQDILHTIEKGKFNAADGYKLSKKLHDNRKRRREIKNELEPLGVLKCNFVDKNKSILTTTYKSVTRKENVLTNLTENQIYSPRVLEKEINSKFIPIPVPSTPQHKEEIIILGNAIHKTTKEKLKVISKVDEEHYVVKKKNGLQVMLAKNIDNLELIQATR
jgi:hypothetical protein